jgi:hypothetical protein
VFVAKRYTEDVQNGPPLLLSEGEAANVLRQPSGPVLGLAAALAVVVEGGSATGLPTETSALSHQQRGLGERRAAAVRVCPAGRRTRERQIGSAAWSSRMVPRSSPWLDCVTPKSFNPYRRDGRK